MRPNLRYLPLLLPALIFWPAEALAQAPPDIATLKQAAAQQVEQEMRGLPSLGGHDLGDVLSITVDKGKLLPTTSLPITGPLSHAITLNGLPGLARVQVLSNETIRTAGGKKFLQLYYRDLNVAPPAPGEAAPIDQYTEITCTPESVLVWQAADEPDGGVSSVQLVQTAADGPRAVTLYVQPPGGKPPRRFSDATVADLSVDYPQEVDAYLRPIFRLFHQEQAAFAVDSRTAYQVFGDLWKNDPPTVAAVNRVSADADAAVAALGADSYADREAALVKLRGLGQPAALHLTDANLQRLSPEQMMRVELFLAPYLPLPDSLVARLARQPSFLLDCMTNSEPAIRRMALVQLERVSGKQINLDVSARGQALDDAVTRLRAVLTAPATQP